MLVGRPPDRSSCAGAAGVAALGGRRRAGEGAAVAGNMTCCA